MSYYIHDICVSTGKLVCNWLSKNSLNKNVVFSFDLLEDKLSIVLKVHQTHDFNISGFNTKVFP